MTMTDEEWEEPQRAAPMQVVSVVPDLLPSEALDEALGEAGFAGDDPIAASAVIRYLAERGYKIVKVN